MALTALETRMAGITVSVLLHLLNHSAHVLKVRPHSRVGTSSLFEAELVHVWTDHILFLRSPPAGHLLPGT